ncbi:hypothetical protein [Mucilaginibacter auburnensis]|uniref:Uncharacterized protein n=1 Tax=Mucilaginibacter auburnensis TaxID=1457233 RepID=A0A2H9VPR5_9SPHI|nr:hypothetical protein [Mucilaginibacter auburnensis]PJJ80317.1 hypothetical protein CLV57_3467 [Mucilaginibacter auburnensis]
MRWFVYIVILLLFAPTLLWSTPIRVVEQVPFAKIHYTDRYSLPFTDTIIKKQPPEEDEKRIKEVQKAKRQAKPEKIDDAQPPKRQRERRPEGMERPPEIPRRNNN